MLLFPKYHVTLVTLLVQMLIGTKTKEDLKAVIAQVGAPTFFFTFSSADMHWPELHALFRNPLSDNTTENRRQNVINNLHITDWFFTQRL